MPAFRPATASPDREAAAAALADALADRRVSTTPRDLVADAGGTRKAASLLGVSTRTVQRRMAGQGAALSAAEQRALAQAGSAARIARVVQQLGGARRVAELTGRNVSTVRRWASGKIQAPRRDARKVLGRADAAIRMRSKGLQVDPATGQPTRSTFLQMTADVRVRGSSKSLSYDQRTKTVGAWGPGVHIDAETIAAVVDALGEGDQDGVRTILEEYLSTNYADCTGYDPGRDVGFFIDRVESVHFEQGDR